MTQDEYRDSLMRMGVSPNTLQALLNAYEAGMHESIDLLTKRKKALDAKYKRDPSINTYSRHREVTNLLAALCEASQRHIDSPQSGCEVSPMAQPKQEQGEPVAVVTGVYGGRFTYAPIKASVILPVGMALYTRPQPRKPLSDEEALKAYSPELWMHVEGTTREIVLFVTRKVEAAHGIKE